MSKRKSILLLYLAVALSAALLLAGCGTKTATPSPAGNKLKVVASVYPVWEFTRQVGGDKVEVAMLVPAGVEPHEWEPTAKEIVTIKSAKLFLYHGAGLENLDKLITKETLGNTVAVAISKDLPLHESAKTEPDNDAAKGQHHDNHADAHLWLDPLRAQQEVAAIANALCAVDPQNADYYRQNAEKYNRELTNLDQEYKNALAQLPRKEIVTSHAAFGYLAERYGLKQLAIMGLTPDSEPTPDKMAEVVKFCRAHNVKVIFFETLLSPRLSETIAKETGARLLVLNPIENLTAEELNQGKNYLSVMRDNLANLKIALAE